MPGDGSLMRQGFTLLWMGWQWDVPDGRMRMEMPIATEQRQSHHGAPPRRIEFVRELPKTATGKIQRFRLRE